MYIHARSSRCAAQVATGAARIACSRLLARQGELAAPVSHAALLVSIVQDQGTDGGVEHALRTLPSAAHTAAKPSLPHPRGLRATW